MAFVWLKKYFTFKAFQYVCLAEMQFCHFYWLLCAKPFITLFPGLILWLHMCMVIVVLFYGFYNLLLHVSYNRSTFYHIRANKGHLAIIQKHFFMWQSEDQKMNSGRPLFWCRALVRNFKLWVLDFNFCKRITI